MNALTKTELKDQSGLMDFGVNRNLFIILSALLLIANFVPVWISYYFPTQNGSLYLTVVQIIKEYHNPAFNFSELYNLDFIIVPNLLFLILAYVFSLFFGIMIGYKIAICINLLLLVVSLFYFLKAIDSKKVIWGFLIFIYLQNFFIAKGYDNFYTSFSIFLFYYGYLIRHTENINLKNYLVLTLFAFLLYISHLFTFLISIFITFIYVLLRYQNRKKIFLVLSVYTIPIVLFIKYLIFIFRQPTESFGGVVLKYNSPIKVMQDFLDMNMFAYSKIPVLFLLIPLLIIFYLVIKNITSFKNRYPDSKSKFGVNFSILLNREVHFFILLGIVFLFAIAPRMVIGWGKFNSRFLPFILFFLIASVLPVPNDRLKKIYIVLVFIFALLNTTLMSNSVYHVGKDFSDYTSGITVIEKNKNLLPIHLEDYHVGNIRPLHWAFNYYTIFNGGATWKNPIFKYPGRIPITYKISMKINSSPLTLPFDVDNYNENEVAKIKNLFDYVLFWGENEKIIKIFEDLGYHQIHYQGKLKLYKKQSTLP